MLNKDGNISEFNENQFQCQLKVMGRIPSVQNSNGRPFDEAKVETMMLQVLAIGLAHTSKYDYLEACTF